MSEPAISAPGFPGEVVETSAQPKAPPVVAPSNTAGLSEAQRKAQEWIDQTAKPAILRGGDSNFLLRANYRKALDFLHRGGPEPEFLTAESGAPKPPDMREADSLRDTFEALAAPATEQQTKAAVSHAVLNGVNPGLAAQVGALCTELGLNESHTRAFLDRVRSHVGRDGDFAAADDIDVLEDHEIGEYVREASRILGSTDKLQELRMRASDYIASRGLASKYEEMGFWRSTLSFDPKLLHTLSMAALRAGVPVGKRP